MADRRKKMLFSLVLLPALAAAGFLCACGGAQDEQRGERAVAVADALQNATVDDLELMPLPHEELGEIAADFNFDDEGSGFYDSEEVADATLDSDDTKEAIEEAGWLGGYRRTYWSPDIGVGLFFVDTSVDLFRDESSAAEALAKDLADGERMEGREIGDGVILVGWETESVEGLGDEAVEIRSEIEVEGFPYRATVIVFRLGRLQAWVQLETVNTPVWARNDEIPRALESRIEGVLLGEITGVPEPRTESETVIASGAS